MSEPLTQNEAHMAAQVIADWLDEDRGGLHDAFPKDAADLESALEKLETIADDESAKADHAD